MHMPTTFLPRLAITFVTFFATIVLGGAISEVMFSPAGFLQNQLILALFVPCLVATWYPATCSRRAPAALIGSASGAMVWALAHGMVAAGAGALLGGGVAAGALFVSGRITLALCRNWTQLPRDQAASLGVDEPPTEEEWPPGPERSEEDSPTVFCSRCGNVQPYVARFCFNCGTRLPALQAASRDVDEPGPTEKEQ